jgi:hypothetical protein
VWLCRYKAVESCSWSLLKAKYFWDLPARTDKQWRCP